MVAESREARTLIDEGRSVSNEDVQGLIQSSWKVDCLLTSDVCEGIYERVVNRPDVLVALDTFVLPVNVR